MTKSNNIKQDPLNTSTILINPGRSLDNSNAYEMVEAITAAQNKGYKYIIIDMARLEFLSSAGVGAILGTVECSREMGGDIILCNVPENIMQILNVLDLADFLTVKATEAEATAICVE